MRVGDRDGAHREEPPVAVSECRRHAFLQRTSPLPSAWTTVDPNCVRQVHAGAIRVHHKNFGVEIRTVMKMSLLPVRFT